MVRFGIIGAGEIARKFVDAVERVPGGEVVAVASKSAERARMWAKEQGVETFYGDYGSLLANSQVDAVYIATTTNAHYENILECLQAGKHVLCEKPLVRSFQEAEKVCGLAGEKQRFLMEAMWTRFLPKTLKVKEWIAEGRIGKVKLMQATIGWKAHPVYNKRLFEPELGGGSLYDLGIYPLEILPYLVDEKVQDIQFFKENYPTGVDDVVSLNVRMQSCFAGMQCSFTTKLPEDAYIYGEKGYIRIPKMHYGNQAFLYNDADEMEDSFTGGNENGFVYEVEEVIRCIGNGQIQSEVCPHQMTLDAAGWIDRVLQGGRIS